MGRAEPPLGRGSGRGQERSHLHLQRREQLGSACPGIGRPRWMATGLGLQPRPSPRHDHKQGHHRPRHQLRLRHHRHLAGRHRSNGFGLEFCGRHCQRQRLRATDRPLADHRWRHSLLRARWPHRGWMEHAHIRIGLRHCMVHPRGPTGQSVRNVAQRIRRHFPTHPRTRVGPFRSRAKRHPGPTVRYGRRQSSSSLANAANDSGIDLVESTFSSLSLRA